MTPRAVLHTLSTGHCPGRGGGAACRESAAVTCRGQPAVAASLGATHSLGTARWAWGSGGPTVYSQPVCSFPDADAGT